MLLPVNPKAGYLVHKEAIDRAIHDVLDSGWYILGKRVQAFEEAFSQYVGVGHGIGVANGTDAVELALRGCGIGPGDGVFTVSHTAVATTVGIERAGATPIFVDINPSTYTLDANKLEESIKFVLTHNSIFYVRPKAIVAVHLYGQVCDMPAIMDIAGRYDLTVIEDCAQAHGASFAGKSAGTWGKAAAFSFYPTKNLGALGDGGMVTTNDDNIAQRVRSLREYGWKQRYISDVPGINSRLDEMQAAILHARLPALDRENARRRELADVYGQTLVRSSLTLPGVAPQREHVFHLYVVQTDERDALRSHLADQGIGTGIHYPVPVHLQPAYQDRLPLPCPLPHTESVARRVLSLPMYPELTAADANRAADVILNWSNSKQAG